MDERVVLQMLGERLSAGGRLLAVYVFGSFSDGRARPDSDIDLAVLCERSLPPELVFDVAQELASALGRDVDLVYLRRASTVLRAQVVGTGRRLLDTAPTLTGEFEMYTLSDYARLNEERRGVREAFEERYRAG